MSKARPLPWVMYIATMGMEMCCLYLGLALLHKYLGLGYLSFALILLLYPLSFFFRLTRALGTSRRGLVFITALMAIVIVTAIVVLAIWQILAVDYSAGALDILEIALQIGFCGLSWLLGNTLVRNEISYRHASGRFQIGMLALLVLAVIEGETFLLVVLFFVLAVLALGLARWESSLAGSIGALRAVQPWQMILGSLAVLLPGTFIFLVLSPDVARAILNWLSAVGLNIVSFLGFDRLAATSGGKPVEFGLFSCSFRPDTGEQGPAVPLPPPPSDVLPTPSPFLQWPLVFAICAAVLVLISLTIYFTIKRVKAGRQARAAEISGVETTRIPVSLFRELADLLKRIGRRLWHVLLSVLGRGRVTRFRPALGDELVVSVRALYRSLLRWAARQGLPRAQSQTPLEYLRALCQKFPQEDKELAVITDVYIQVRYSRQPTTSEEFEVAKQAWQKIKLASSP